MATAPTANDLTRQQLDELDALLQRMLSSPGGSEPLNATPAPAASNWRIDPPGPTLSMVPHVAAPLPRPADPEPPAPPPPVRAPEPRVPAPEPAVPIEEFKFIPTSAPAERRPSHPPASTAPAYSPRATAESVPMVLMPLVGVNWVVDTALGFLGPPGKFIRSAFGKNLLGFIGIGLLAYTTAHIAVDQGWLSLPFVLPWPK